MSFNICLHKIEKTAISDATKRNIEDAVGTAGMFAAFNALRPRYAGDRLRAAGRGAAAGLGLMAGNKLDRRITDSGFHMPYPLLPAGSALGAAHLAGKFIPHRTKEQREQEREKNAAAVDEAKRLARGVFYGSAIGGLNSMRGKYKGNRGEGFVRGLGGTIAAGYGARAGSSLGRWADSNTGIGPSEVIGGIGGFLAGAKGGSRAAGALYNKLRGKKKEEEKKDV